MKNIRMLLLALAPLTIMTQVPMTIYAMKLRSISLKNKQEFDLIERSLKRTYTNYPNSLARLAMQGEVMKSLPKLSGFWGTLFIDKDLVKDFAYYIFDKQLIEQVVLCPFVEKEIVVHLLKYIQQEYPMKLQGIINSSLEKLHLQIDGLVDGKEFSREKVIIMNVLLDCHEKRGPRLIELVSAFLDKKQNESAYKLVENFIDMHFDAEVETIADLLSYVEIKDVETQEKAEKDALRGLGIIVFRSDLLKKLSVEQCFKILNVYAEQGDYEAAYNLLQNIKLNKSPSVIYNINKLLPRIEKYNSDQAFRDEIQKIIGR